LKSILKREYSKSIGIFWKDKEGDLISLGNESQWRHITLLRKNTVCLLVTPQKTETERVKTEYISFLEDLVDGVIVINTKGRNNVLEFISRTNV